ncbi:MAG: M28 family peptidase [Actinomycetota bacterium]|nr:M28 family peptidase [Actinomycetota bacterium]
MSKIKRFKGKPTGIGRYLPHIFLMLLPFLPRLAAWLARKEGERKGYEVRQFKLNTRDGKRLSTALYVPVGEGPFPAIIMVHSWMLSRWQCHLYAPYFASSGYVVLSYDCRGWGPSGGSVQYADPDTEIKDLMEAIYWLTERSGLQLKEGALGITGISYGGRHSFLVSSRDRRVRTVVPMCGWTDLEKSITLQGTLKIFWRLALLFSASWATRLNPANILYRWTYTIFLKRDEIKSYQADMHSRSAIYEVEKAGCPMLIVGAWNDEFFEPNQMMWYYRKVDAPRMLYFSNGLHGMDPGVGPRLWGKDIWELTRCWFDYWLKEEDNGILSEPAVRLYRPWTRSYATKEERPPGDVEERDFYLAGENGRRVLSEETPGIHGRAALVPKLLSPVSSGPTLLCPRAFGITVPGPGRDSGKGYFSFTTDPTDGDYELLGIPELRLTLLSPEERAQVNALLYEVPPKGRPRLITHGTATLEGLNPGDELEVTVELIARSYRIRKRSPHTPHTQRLQSPLRPARHRQRRGGSLRSERKRNQPSPKGGEYGLRRMVPVLAATMLAALFSLSITTAPGLVERACADGGTCGEARSEASRNWYFAEGYTGAGFEEWLCLLNPQDQASNLDLELLFSSGSSQFVDIELPPRSRTTLRINTLAGEDKEVSLSLRSEYPILAERPIYFNYRSEWMGCSTTGGTSSASNDWYFAEGCTREGFEEWLLLANPGEEDSQATISFCLQDGETISLALDLPPRSRRTVFVNQAVGEDKDVSARVEARRPICVERVMYFDYHGFWPGGHASVGSSQPRTSYLFAEGYTGAGFEEWLCLYLPEYEGGPDSADVLLSCLFEDGKEEVHRVSLLKERRHTININQLAGEGRNVSLELTGQAPFLAERPMYFNYNGHCRGGHVSTGVESAGALWRMAEGTTRPGFHTYLCLVNPGDEETRVEVDFVCNPGGTTTSSLDMAARSRSTVNVKERAGGDQDVSFEIRSDKPVAVERSLYNPGTGFMVQNAMDHLWDLSVVIGLRVEGTVGELAAADYLAGVMESYGYQPWIQEAPLPNGSFTRNVIADLPGTGEEGVLVVGGHYDTKINTGSPGANDNGSGTVVTLELARCFAELPARPDLRFIFFGGEERLVEGTDLHHFGSRYYVESLTSREKEEIVGAIIIDMVGVGAQLYARNMGVGPMDLCKAMMAYASDAGIHLPYMLSGSYSDHEPFELAGIPAVWLEYKDDPWYHTYQDSYDKIVPSFIDNTGRLLEGFIRSF